MFHALTTQVYKNPAYSVIAEICANAWDSHICAKNTDTPFIVQLPNVLEPFFSVRDFGTSMSHEFMLQKYTEVFFSTKENNNKENGAFGIGRLTCITLSETYSAICYLNGKKRTYSVFTQNSEPRIAFINEEETVEKDGFEVIASVSSDFFSAFKVNAARILSFYPVKPTVLGCSDFLFDERKYTLISEDKTWAFADNERSSIIMGVYSYPIDPSLIPDTTSTQKEILSNGLHIFVNLGQVSVNLSRDGLFYDKKTVALIKNRVNSLSTYCDDIIQKKIDECPSFISAIKLYWSVFNLGGSLYSMRHFISNKTGMLWKNLPISQAVLDLGALVKSDDSKTAMSCWEKSWRRGGWTMRERQVSSLFLKQNTHIFLNDLNNGIGVKKRLRYLISNLTIQAENGIVVLKASDEFIKAINLIPSDYTSLKSVIVPASENTTRDTSLAVKRRKCKVFTFSGKVYHRYQSKNWNVCDTTWEDILEETPGIYVELESRFDWSGHNYIAELQSFKIPLPTFLGIRQSESALIEELKKNDWETLSEFYTRSIKEYVMANKDKWKQMISDYDASHIDGVASSLINIKYNNLFDELKALADIATKNRREDPREYRRLLNIFYPNELKTLPNPTIDIQSSVNKILSRYPMAKLINQISGYGSYRYFNDVRSEYLKYFKDIDELLELKSAQNSEIILDISEKNEKMMEIEAPTL
jgi:hypothetical protein